MAVNNADFSATFTLVNTDGTPYNLTGASLEMQFKPWPPMAVGFPQPLAVLTLTTASGSGITVVSPATSGVFSILIPFAQMNTLNPRTYVFDILNNVSSGSRVFLGGGLFNVTEGVSENP